MLDDVTKRVDAELTRLFHTNQNCLKFLLNHERKTLLIRNLCNEIYKAEKLVINFDVNKYQRVIKDFTRQFATSALQHLEEKLLTEAERNRRIKEANRLVDAQEFIDDLEKETLRANQDEDWAKAEIQKRILSKTD